MYTQEEIQYFEDHHFAFLKVELKNEVLHVTLNRPGKKNALNPQMINELTFALSCAKYEEKVRLVLLQAEGDVFCAGADLDAFAGKVEANDSSVLTLKDQPPLLELFRNTFKPIVAVVKGHVYAGGNLLLAGCTHVVASETVRFSLPETQKGLFPFQVMGALLELMPDRLVLDWCLRGESWTAKEACANGLITKYTSIDDIDKEVKEIICSILDKDPLAIRMGLEAYAHLKKNTAKSNEYLQKMLFQLIQNKHMQNAHHHPKN